MCVYIYIYIYIQMQVGGQAPHLVYCNDIKFQGTDYCKDIKFQGTDYTVRYVLSMVAPVGSDSRCLIRHILIWFGANINI